jgi:hypothetical protein
VGVLVGAHRQAAPLLESVEAPLDGVAVLVVSQSNPTGRPPWLPRRMRLTFWSLGYGMLGAMSLLRSSMRFLREL